MPMTLKGSGTITGSSGPIFSAGKSAALQTLTVNAHTKVIFDNELVDSSGCYDPALSRFTPNVAGYYDIKANIALNNTTSTNCLVMVHKNGTAYRTGPSTTAAGAERFTVNCLVYLNGSTDYVEIVFKGETVAPVILNQSSSTYFQGYLVRAA